VKYDEIFIRCYETMSELYQGLSAFFRKYNARKYQSLDHHWALDRHLITPFATETKLVWRTAPCLDDRLEGHKELLKLEGRSVLLPREKRFWPADKGLQWRAERLRGIVS